MLIGCLCYLLGSWSTAGFMFWESQKLYVGFSLFRRSVPLTQVFRGQRSRVSAPHPGVIQRSTVYSFSVFKLVLFSRPGYGVFLQKLRQSVSQSMPVGLSASVLELCFCVQIAFLLATFLSFPHLLTMGQMGSCSIFINPFDMFSAKKPSCLAVG